MCRGCEEGFTVTPLLPERRCLCSETWKEQEFGQNVEGIVPRSRRAEQGWDLEESPDEEREGHPRCSLTSKELPGLYGAPDCRVDEGGADLSNAQYPRSPSSDRQFYRPNDAPFRSCWPK